GFELPLPGLMSATIVVPLAVPSLVHSSCPFLPSLAVKNSFPLTLVRLPGLELALPLTMSATRTVPVVVVWLPLVLVTVVPVPSLFQSSRPCTPSSAVKYSMPFTLVRLLGEELLGPYQ